MSGQDKQRISDNPISLTGLLVAVVSTAVGLPLMFVDIFSSGVNPYTGIWVYMVLPAVAALGVAILLAGLWIEKRRRLMPGHMAWQFPRFDLNEPRQRTIVLGVLAGSIVMMVLLSITSYRAYNFTDSVQFCGEVCHGVMKPEYTAYQHSPHARVACVECHVGSGPGWYLKSKLNGAHQVYSLAFHKYSRPIPSPVANLRPSADTCEQCHWPAKFFGAQQKTFHHTLADEKNSPWQIEALIKIGGGGPSGTGIHWHMNINKDIYYIASDDKREVIPWVKAVSKDGHVTEYLSSDSAMSAAELAKAVPRRMDCIDCHNRPTHIYHAPDGAMDTAFAAGELDRGLPYLKREGMRLLSADYKTEDEAKAAIGKGLHDFYAASYPAVLKVKGTAIQQATTALQSIFAANVFPEMKTDWRSHSDHIGHLNSDGCFRCHDGLHKSTDGKVITNDCNTCHTFLAQGTPEAVAKARLQAQPFHHPVDVGVDMKDVKCSTCHSGTAGL